MEYTLTSESFMRGVWAFAGDGDITCAPADVRDAARKWLLAGEWSGCDAARVTIEETGDIITVSREEGGWPVEEVDP